MSTTWMVSDQWEQRPNDKALGKDRNIFVLDADLSVASICHVACVPVSSPLDVHEKALRDARLIAAAPDLLQRLKEIKVCLQVALMSFPLDIAKEGMEVVREAEAAITKAEAA